jgi:7,8-dihydroneopterin aldolase/epimerase/oxygenase
MGTIVIENMEFYAFHGHYREEQIVGNRFLVDLEIETDMERAGQTDRLEDATDYQIAFRTVKSEMDKKSYLLENIATRILDSLYANLPGIRKATVRIRKMNPPLGGNIGSVGVTLTR